MRKYLQFNIFKIKLFFIINLVIKQLGKVLPLSVNFFAPARHIDPVEIAVAGLSVLNRFTVISARCCLLAR